MVDDVDDAVFVKVPFARVPDPVYFNTTAPSRCSDVSRHTHMHVHAQGVTLTVRVPLVRVNHEPAVVVLVQHAVIIVVVITFISLSRQ